MSEPPILTDVVIFWDIITMQSNAEFGLFSEGEDGGDMFIRNVC
jgi:hypothetical protein